MELYTLDLGQFSTGSPAERAAIAQAFDGAFRTAGFCYLTGYEHLLPEATIDALRAQSTAFFALPAAEKEKSRVDGEIGYLGPGAEKSRSQIYRQHFRPLARLNLGKRPGGPNQARIVEGDMQAAKRRTRGSDRLIVRARFRNVSNDGESATTLIFDFVDR